jgi:hypothetical protein
VACFTQVVASIPFVYMLALTTDKITETALHGHEVAGDPRQRAANHHVEQGNLACQAPPTSMSLIRWQPQSGWTCLSIGIVRFVNSGSRLSDFTPRSRAKLRLATNRTGKAGRWKLCAVARTSQ